MDVYKKWIVLAAVPLILMGCSDRFAEKANESQEEDQPSVETTDNSEVDVVQEEQNQNDETDQVVTAEDVQKAVDHNEVEKKEIMDDLEIEAKEEFRDPTDFAKYVSKVVFNFQNGKMAAEDYYNFIQQHGSEKLIEGYPETKAEAMVVLETLQNMLIEKRDQTTVYILSEVGFNRNKREGYYYRLEKDGPDE